VKHAARKLAVVAATVFAIAAPAWQATTGWGLSAAEFSRAGDRTLRAAGYAFSIWTLIYLGLVGFAVYQLLPRSDGSGALRRAGWPAAAAIAGCGAWILASAADLEWLTVAVIALSASAAIWALLQVKGATKAERVFVTWPMAWLAGWLTVATALNPATVATELGYVPGDLRAPVAVGGVLAVWAVAFAVLRSARAAAYVLPVSWGLIAVFVAERQDNPLPAWTAIAGAIVLPLLAGQMARSTACRR
jgi:hypothetical protein